MRVPLLWSYSQQQVLHSNKHCCTVTSSTAPHQYINDQTSSRVTRRVALRAYRVRMPVPLQRVCIVERQGGWLAAQLQRSTACVSIQLHDMQVCASVYTSSPHHGYVGLSIAATI